MSFASHLKKLCEQNGTASTLEALKDAITESKINVNTVSIPELARTFLGDVYSDAKRKLAAVMSGNIGMLEASEATDASAFSNITGQLLVTVVKEKYNSPEFIGDKLCRTIPNPGGNLKDHKVPYLSDVLGKPKLLAQGEPYPFTSFAESWITLPAPERRGEICAITMEMLYSDLTGQAQDSVGSVAKALRYQKEERQLRVVLGITNPYKFNDTAMNTYLSTENATGKYVNRTYANTITNYSHINTVEQMFYVMRDPITDRRIYARPTAALCMPEKRYELKRVLNAIETRSGDITTGTGDQVIAPNPLDVNYPILTSAIAQALLDDETSLTANEIKQYVIFADFQKAFGYREVAPMRSEIAPANNPMEFHQDIVMAVKVSEFGVPFVYDPRFAALSTAESS